jgi:hypothetical protein
MNAKEIVATALLGAPLVFGLWVLGSTVLVGRRRPLRDDDGVWRMPKVKPVRRG